MSFGKNGIKKVTRRKIACKMLRNTNESYLRQSFENRWGVDRKTVVHVFLRKNERFAVFETYKH